MAKRTKKGSLHQGSHAKLVPRGKEDLRRETLSAMTASPSSSDYSSAEDSASECNSNQSLSVGHFPSENMFSYEDEDMVSSEETASADSLVHFLPPVQGTWGTESLRRLLRKRHRMEHDPEQFCKLSIMPAWDNDVGSNQADSLANLDLNGYSQWVDKWPKDRTKLTLCKLDNLVQKLETVEKLREAGQPDDRVLPESTYEEDIYLNSSPPPQTAQVSHEEHDVCQDLPKYKAQENRDMCQVLQDPPRLQEDEIEQETRQTAESSLEISSMSSAQEEEPSRSHGTSCLNFRWVFHWLRTQVFSRWRRERPRQATSSWHQKAVRKIQSLRGNRIRPQE